MFVTAGRVGVLRASSGWRPRMMLNTLQCTQHSPAPPQQGQLVPNVNRFKVEKYLLKTKFTPCIPSELFQRVQEAWVLGMLG